MKKHTLEADAPQFLSGWKEIANHLGMGVRTVQRYERDLGLPVRRPAGKSRGSVVAVRAELDGWVKASPIRKVFPLHSQSQTQAPSQSQVLLKGLSELMALRDQMIMLRAEVRESVQKLRSSVNGIQHDLIRGELERRQTGRPSQLYSKDEYETLDRVAAMSASIKYPKAS